MQAGSQRYWCGRSEMSSVSPGFFGMFVFFGAGAPLIEGN
jgi:hypothetical protein